MYWSLSLIVMAGLSAPEIQGTQTPTYASYSKAYWQANAMHRPMLVIMNPAAEGDAAQEAVSLQQLQQDERFRTALNDYVVVVLDTGSEHGRAVHDLFKNPPLPRIVVIDDRQDKQVFQTSEPLEPEAFARVLEQHRNGGPATNVTRYQPTPGSLNSFQPGGSCPNCRRFQ